MDTSNNGVRFKTEKSSCKGLFRIILVEIKVGLTTTDFVTNEVQHREYSKFLRSAENQKQSANLAAGRHFSQE
jgi:hypothetical protein